MACNSIIALAKAQCTTNVPGISDVYIIAYNDLVKDASGAVFTAATNGLVSTVDVATGKAFVKVEVNKDSAGLTEAMTKNSQSGNLYMTQTFTMNLTGLSVETRNWVESVMNQEVVILFRDRGKTPKYYTAGIEGGLELTTLEGGSGVSQDDVKGYNLTFSGIASALVPQVDASIVAGLLVPAA